MMKNPAAEQSLSAFRCFVPGHPRTQGSSRAFVVGGRAVVTSDNRRLHAWREAMRADLDAARRSRLAADPSLCGAHRAPDPAAAWGREAVLFHGPVSVAATFAMPRLRGHPKTPGVPVGHPLTGDLDKLCRALGDALEAAHVVANDRHIVAWCADKRYADVGETPGVHVAVRPAARQNE